MKILSIETSCDDTSIAVTENLKILSNVVSSQIKIHQKWGGVYPSLAKREHQKNLIPVLKRALEKSKIKAKKNEKEAEKNDSKLDKNKKDIKLKVKKVEFILKREPELLNKTLKFLKEHKKPKIDRIAVTFGPGLEPCLWTGLNLARALSYYWDIPIMPINHIEAHILANFVEKNRKKILDNTIKIKESFPALCLIVSGGHTQLILMKDIGKYKIIGETRDDAAGECFDKTARILGLPYPGGPEISKLASKCSLTNKKLNFFINLPRPMIKSKDYDFSFSGLKTAVLYKVEREKEKLKNKRYIQEMAKEIEEAITDVLVEKTIKAAKSFFIKTIILGGGVSANKKLRKKIKEKAKGINLLIPEKSLTGDNAAMIGIASFLKKEKEKSWKNIKVNANLRI